MQLRLIGSLTSLTLCGLALVAQTSAPNAQKPSETPKTAHQLFVEDQDDLNGPDKQPRFTEQEYFQRVKARQSTLREMLAAGEIKTGDDFRDAAYIFQHSDKPDDCLFAHEGCKIYRGGHAGPVSAIHQATASIRHTIYN
jgi:hypothetical protein